MGVVVAAMTQQLGAPTREAGSRSAGYLASVAMHTAIVEYRFKDYIADISATNIPGRGLMMREHYKALAERPRRGFPRLGWCGGPLFG